MTLPKRNGSAISRRSSLRALLVIAAVNAVLWCGEGEAAQLQLTWSDNSTNESGFAVERRAGGAGYTQVAIVGPNLTSYADWGLTPGAGYCYRVRAFNAGGASPYSNEACGTATTMGPGEPRLITGPGAGGGPRVSGFTASGAAAALNFFAYTPAFTGGLSVALAEMDGGSAIVTGAGSGGGPHVQAFRLSGTPTGLSFMAYHPAFSGGIRVAACDLDGDGESEIVTAPGPGGGPHIRIWKRNGPTVTLLAEFFAYDPGFTGGVFVACGDVEGTGHPDVVTAAGAGGGPHVRVWRVSGGSVSEVTGFLAYAPAFTGGVFVATGDVDSDHRAEIITGTGAGGGPHIRVWRLSANGVATEVVGFMAYNPAFVGGVRVAAGHLEATGPAAIITGAGPGGGPHVQTFTVQGTTVAPGLSFFAYEPSFTGGVFVAGTP